MPESDGSRLFRVVRGELAEAARRAIDKVVPQPPDDYPKKPIDLALAKVSFMQDGYSELVIIHPELINIPITEVELILNSFVRFCTERDVKP